MKSWPSRGMRHAAVWALAGLAAGCATEASPAGPVARGDMAAVSRQLAQGVPREMKRLGVTGLSVALVDDQRVVWAQGFGFADKEAGLPATADTVYRAGSVSKLFTTVAAMQLSEQGRLDIDAPLQKVLPGFSVRVRDAAGAAGAITPRQLMTHHAGLPRDLLKGMWTPHPLPIDAVAASLRDSDAVAPPGAAFSYSNLGFSLLGQAVQTVAGVPFAEQVRREVLVPLGMDHAAFEPGVSASPLMARAYSAGHRFEEPPLRDVPAGGLNASVSDMARFLSMLFADGRAGDRQVLQPGTLREMARVQNEGVALDENFHVGLGWMLSTLGTDTIQGAGPVLHHAGATLYFHSQLFALPAHKLGVVVMSNSAESQELVNRLATRTLALALQAKAGIAQPEPASEPTAAADPPGDAFVGDYATQAGLVRVTGTGGHLKAEALGRTFDLVSRPGGEVGVRYRLLGVIPLSLGPLEAMGLSVRQVAGRDTLVARIGAQRLRVGQRVDTVPIPESWRRRLGRYEVENLGADQPLIGSLRLREDRGLLVAEVSLLLPAGQALSFPLRPLSSGEALVLDSLGAWGDLLRATGEGSQERLTYSGYRLRRTGP